MENKVESKLATIINYCGNDKNFIGECIDNIYDISDVIIVPICEKYFDGVNEDFNDLKRLLYSYGDLSKIRIVAYPMQWNSNEHNSNYGHNVSRWVGILNIPNNIDYILFLDADEIVIKDKFSDFYKNIKSNYDAYKFSCYWYFRDKLNQAKTLESCGLLCKNNDFINRRDFILNAEHERNTIFDSFDKRIDNYKYNNEIMINHYSWVRTKEEMIRKVTCWGHKNDKNWIDLIEKEFEHEFNGTDFVHGYEYNIK